MRKFLRLERRLATIVASWMGGLTLWYAVHGVFSWVVLASACVAVSGTVALRATPELKRAFANPARAPSAPTLKIREARHPDPLPAKQKGVTCRICGMDDPQRFRLKIGVAQWRGWPVHDACVEWLAAGPKPDRADGIRCPSQAHSVGCPPPTAAEQVHRMAREIRDAEMRKQLGDVASVIIAPGEQRDAILRGLGTVAHAGTAIAMDAPRYIPLLDGRDWGDPPF